MPLLGLIALFITAPAWAAAEVGHPAPDFEAQTASGETFKLSDHKGEIVVLEWTNHECPFVMKHYGTGNMQKTQTAAREEGVTWVSIVSSAPGRQGNTSAEEALKIAQDAGADINAKILDESGEIGHLYDAKTTPHMFVIDANGMLAYAGAIDDQPSPNPKTVEGAHNYVLAAIKDLKTGRAVETPQTASYGCGVKY
ncbi:MAG: redoxin domain-containing protein [Alphaproteobacteria bacterium]|nr:redoxin domain-containing protein [Alphaproteobacteria bacterium]